MSFVVVVGDPVDGALDACGALGTCGTLAWGGADALRDYADRLADLGWDALLVDPVDEALATGAMSLLAQTRGHADALVIHAGLSSAQPVFDVAVMVARHLPVVPVVLTGAGAVDFAGQWKQPAHDLELDEARVVDLAHLTETWHATAGRPIDTES